MANSLDTRRAEYRDHLQSPEWREIREISKDRTHGLCAHCGAVATEVHHVKYPKRFAEDSITNTVPVCDRCHKLNHGVLPMLALTQVSEMREITPIGGEFIYLVSEGVPWATIEEWVRALRFPSKGHLETVLWRSCNQLVAEGETPSATYGKQTVYRWLTVSRALLDLYAAFKEKGGLGRDNRGVTPQEWDAWMSGFLRYYTWGSKLQEKVISHVMQSRPQIGPKSDLAQAMALIAKVQAGQGEEIEEIKNSLHKNPDEFITAKQALLEKGMDDTVMPVDRDGRTWSGLLGTALAKQSCEKGPASLVRFEASSIKRSVSTWRRGDAYAQIEAITKWLRKR